MGKNVGFGQIVQKNVSQQKFNLTMISTPKILEFHNTSRKTWHFDTQGEIGPIKVGPNFDGPNFGLNFKMPSFPQIIINSNIFMLKIIVRLNVVLGQNFLDNQKNFTPRPIYDLNNLISPQKIALRQKFNLTMILNMKILEFYYTLRKTWHFEVQAKIWPSKFGPIFIGPISP